jgi:putative tricarboxylic transport membrane protein
MEQHKATPGEDKSVVSTRTMDVVAALFFVVIGALVVYDSIRLGNSWGDSGPEPGYFPFYIGLVLIFAGAGTAVQALFGTAWKASGDAPFVTRGRLKSVLMVFLPTAAFVVIMQFTGLYVAAAIYISGFMIINGKYPFIKTIPFAIVVPIVIFAMFEIWFLVPLPKGPVEAMLGF